MTFDEKLKAFAELVERQQRRRYLEQWPEAPEAILANSCTATIKSGKKYVKIDVGSPQGGSGKLMIEIATGEIYGIKAYGVIHRGHYYGTLDTTALYWWGDYYPRKLAA